MLFSSFKFVINFPGQFDLTSNCPRRILPDCISTADQACVATGYFCTKPSFGVVIWPFLRSFIESRITSSVTLLMFAYYKLMDGLIVGQNKFDLLPPKWTCLSICLMHFFRASAWLIYLLDESQRGFSSDLSQPNFNTKKYITSKTSQTMFKATEQRNTLQCFIMVPWRTPTTFFCEP